MTEKELGAKKIFVVVDLGGTIVDEKNPEMGAISEEITRKYQLSVQQAMGLISGIVMDLMQENMKTTVEQKCATTMIEEFLKKANCPLTVEQVEEMAWYMLGGENSTYLQPLEGAEELLEQISKTGANVVALSNTALTLNILNRIFEVHNIKNRFKDIILSSECGYRKPYAPIFEFLESKENITKDDLVILLGNDLKADIEPAKQRGYKTVLYTKDMSLEENESMLIGHDLETCKNKILNEISEWRKNK